MNTFTKKIYKGYPFTIKAQAHKYYDYNLTTRVYEDTTSQVELKPYAGIDVTEDNGIITISAGELPDGSMFEGQIGYFGEIGSYFLANNQILPGLISSFITLGGMPGQESYSQSSLQYNYYSKDVRFTQDEKVSGFTWLWTGRMDTSVFVINDKINFVESGNPIYDGHNVTFQGSGDYLTANKKLHEDLYVDPDADPIGDKYECIAKVTTPSSLSSYKLIARSSESNRCFGTYGASWCLYDGSSRYVGGTVEKSKTYWVKVVQDYDTAYKTTLYTLEDNGYSLTSLPTEGWTEQTSVAKDIFVGGNHFTVGTSSAYYWDGVIDLDNFVLKRVVASGTEVYWKPLSGL